MAQLVWLITGCSSGFGSAFVSEILTRGDLVIATSRNVDKIAHLSQSGVTLLQLDVSNSQESLDKTVAAALEVYGRIDVLVNNAGYIATGSWEDVKEHDLVTQFDINVFGPVRVTKAVLPHMRARKQGTLVFMGSRSGWYGDPFCGPYSGSKFALEGMVESLRWETAPLGIRTLLVDPGRFRTGFLSSAGNLGIAESKVDDYKEPYQTFLGYLAAEDGQQPGDVAKAVKIIADVVRREGSAKDAEVPFRLLLGSDCFDTVKEKCEETLKVMKQWEGIIKSTDL
ncbi:hypothetical protein B0T16DRAFT_421386 [Cercophora newfieldiana]|uniref:Uncharacterized protein n=1 Tax=Cercophora newfieldiana TaxID=92897 RepID=A0AA40CHG1_9PEZI|nr:hypothetical protein B0T16DRAFT_421386 [Cercophora newfieldiana]